MEENDLPRGDVGRQTDVTSSLQAQRPKAWVLRRPCEGLPLTWRTFGAGQPCFPPWWYPRWCTKHRHGRIDLFQDRMGPVCTKEWGGRLQEWSRLTTTAPCLAPLPGCLREFPQWSWSPGHWTKGGSCARVTQGTAGWNKWFVRRPFKSGTRVCVPLLKGNRVTGSRRHSVRSRPNGAPVNTGSLSSGCRRCSWFTTVLRSSCRESARSAATSPGTANRGSPTRWITQLWSAMDAARNAKI